MGNGAGNSARFIGARSFLRRHCDDARSADRSAVFGATPHLQRMPLDSKLESDVSAVNDDEFRKLCAASHWPCGFESTHCFDVDKDERYIDVRHIPSLTTTLFHQTTLRNALNRLVRMHSKYRWRRVGGVLNLYPKAKSSSDVMSKRLAKISIRKAASLTAFRKLLEQAGLKVVNGDAIEGPVANEPLSSYRVINLELENVTLRDAFNAIATSDGSVLWEFGPDPEMGGVCFSAYSWGPPAGRIRMR